jgi:hypothetical protein
MKNDQLNCSKLSLVDDSSIRAAWINKVETVLTNTVFNADFEFDNGFDVSPVCWKLKGLNCIKSGVDLMAAPNKRLNSYVGFSISVCHRPL